MSRTLPDVHGPTTRAVAVCAGVSRTFRRGGHEVPAVRDVSCTIHPGMRIALTGPSGSGKSTLLHLLAGLDRPTAGTITRPGLPPAEPWSSRVGVAFQGPSLVPTLDALENVTLPLLIDGVDENAAVVRAAALLDRLEIRDLAGHLPDELSGGQAQRVGIARALVRAPLLVLADEPTGQLDRATADHVMAVLVDSARESGSALLVSTHDPLVSGPLPVHWSMADGGLTTDGPR